MRALIVAALVLNATAGFASDVCWEENAYDAGLAAVVTDGHGSLLYTTSDLVDCKTVTEGRSICVDEAGVGNTVLYKIVGNQAVFDFHGEQRIFHRIQCE